MPAHRTRRERKLEKADQLRIWADGRDSKGDAAHASVKAITDRIPIGQPILIGHHSERGARADQNRIQSGMDRACENWQKAERMRQKAANIEAQAHGSIYSDDPDAIERLTAKLAKLEAERDAMKARNAEYRKAHRDELKSMGAYERGQAVPFPSWAITNIGATIRTTQKRIAELSTPEVGRVLTVKWSGECRSCGDEIPAGDQARYFKRTRELEHIDCTHA